MLTNYALTNWEQGGMKDELIKYIISYNVFIRSVSRLALSAEDNTPSSTLWCFEIIMLKMGNPFHFLCESWEKVLQFTRLILHLETGFSYWQLPSWSPKKCIPLAKVVPVFRTEVRWSVTNLTSITSSHTRWLIGKLYQHLALWFTLSLN